jgi:hypothetical protein
VPSPVFSSTNTPDPFLRAEDEYRPRNPQDPVTVSPFVGARELAQLSGTFQSPRGTIATAGMEHRQGPRQERPQWVRLRPVLRPGEPATSGTKSPPSFALWHGQDTGDGWSIRGAGLRRALERDASPRLGFQQKLRITAVVFPARAIDGHTHLHEHIH